MVRRSNQCQSHRSQTRNLRALHQIAHKTSMDPTMKLQITIRRRLNGDQFDRVVYCEADSIALAADAAAHEMCFADWDEYIDSSEVLPEIICIRQLIEWKRRSA